MFVNLNGNPSCILMGDDSVDEFYSISLTTGSTSSARPGTMV